ncbi:unnamed protein product [Vitrella brassicaformis CCMP3155]|uniref:Uncharacterized protein n=1 Tax=Vitrella brassicaformis (strain CCMP3155) TaxID=1169540 RepID=A0A0G4FMW0_VITBC|nr:unnamed protein product [Vitrella brassicaformis CCMP3155]|eukprot:CEM15519.1 unnamed protein product [Vitrella brassicaformis CCMP3155]
MIDRHVDNNQLDTIMTQSPHTSVEGCTTTASRRNPGGHTHRQLVLTGASHSFVASIYIIGSEYINTVRVQVHTTESAVYDVGGAFKDRFPETTRLARVVLGTNRQVGRWW